MSLFVVGTPIGNLQDITLRALEVLRSSNLIIAESIPDSSRLLQLLDIKGKKLLKYNDRNKDTAIPEIIKKLKDEDAVFITSAGMPGVSDPGEDLVSACYQNNISVIPIPGVSALTTALSVCGLNGKRVIFLGFLPRKKSLVETLMNQYLEEDSLVVFFESPFRIVKSLNNIKGFLPDLNIFVGREMTKKFESYKKGALKDILSEIEGSKNAQKGEFTIILSK